MISTTDRPDFGTLRRSITVSVVFFLATGCLDDPAAPPANAQPAAAELDEAKLAQVFDALGVKCLSYSFHKESTDKSASPFALPGNDTLALRDFEKYLKESKGTPLERLKRAAKEAAIHSPNLEILARLEPAQTLSAKDVRAILGPEDSTSSGTVGELEESSTGREEAVHRRVTFLNYGWCSLGYAPEPDQPVIAIKVQLKPFMGTPSEWKANRLRKGY